MDIGCCVDEGAPWSPGIGTMDAFSFPGRNSPRGKGGGEGLGGGGTGRGLGSRFRGIENVVWSPYSPFPFLP